MTHPKGKVHFTELQQAILDFLWKVGSGSSEDVRAALQPKHPLKDSSVRTLLRRLEQRGFLRHRLEGKTFIYEPAVPQQSVAGRAARHLIERFFAGSAEQFLLGLVDEKILSVEEIRELTKRVTKTRSPR